MAARDDADDRAEDRAIGARIEEATKGLSLPEAAALAGCSVNTFRRWVKGEGSADAKGLRRIALARGVTLEWLLGGSAPDPALVAAERIGSTIKRVVSDITAPRRKAESTASAVVLPSTNLDATVAIRVLDVVVSAGNGAVNGDHLPARSIDFPAIFLRGETDVAQLSLLRVTGDSMEPDLRADDWVLVNARRREDAGIHVIRRDDQLTVKRIQRQGGTMRLISTNALYAAEEIDMAKEGSAFEVIGKVIWGGRWF